MKLHEAQPSAILPSERSMLDLVLAGFVAYC